MKDFAYCFILILRKILFYLYPAEDIQKICIFSHSPDIKQNTAPDRVTDSGRGLCFVLSLWTICECFQQNLLLSLFSLPGGQ